MPPERPGVVGTGDQAQPPSPPGHRVPLQLGPSIRHAAPPTSAPFANPGEAYHGAEHAQKSEQDKRKRSAKVAGVVARVRAISR